MSRYDPYNKFKNDTDRRLALRAKEIRLAVVGVSFSIAFGLAGSNISPEMLRWLRALL